MFLMQDEAAIGHIILLIQDQDSQLVIVVILVFMVVRQVSRIVLKVSSSGTKS